MSKEITHLTDEQKARIPEYIKKWIDIGLKTGEADWDTFDKYMPICYEKAGLKYPKNVVRVKSPLIGALSASIAMYILKNGSEVDSAVGTEVSSAVSMAVGSVVGSAVSTAVGSAVSTVVGSAVGSEVGSAVGSEVGSAVSMAVGTEVDSEVIEKLKKKVICHNWLGGQFWVGGCYNGNSFIWFFIDVCGLKLSSDIMERAVAYRKINESVNYIWCNRDFVIVCDRPKEIHRDDNGKLHNPNGMSIRYGDNWGLYHLHGVKFTPKEWQEYRFADAEKILSCPNTDQRAVLIATIGFEKLFKGD